MQENDFKELLKDDSFINYCLNRNADDTRQWQAWITANPEHAGDLEAIKQLVIGMGLHAANDAVTDSYHKLQERIGRQHQTDRPYFGIYRSWLKYAAAVVLIAGAAVIWLSRKPTVTSHLAETVAAEIGPGDNKAVLTLADGSKLSLTDATNGQLVNHAGITVTKTAEGEIVYASKAATVNPKNADAGFNTLETPRGGQYQVVLPDGSKAWLNAASSLKYPVSFAGGERRVEMTGEVYFEIAKNKRKPFHVLSAGQEISVLGTHFNVNAYADEPAPVTTLLEGSIKIASLTTKKSAMLKPGQRAEVLDRISIAPADIDAEMAWKNGDFIFKSEELQSIMRKVSRWYNVDVAYQPGMASLKFDGMVSRSHNISAVLNMMESTGKIHFKIEGRRVTVMK